MKTLLAIDIQIILKLTRILALIVIGAGIAVFGILDHIDDIKQVGYLVIGIGVLVIIIFTILSVLHKKNYF